MAEHDDLGVGEHDGRKQSYQGDERRTDMSVYHDLLYGGPGGKGLVHVVPELSQSVADLTKTVNKLSETVNSDGGVKSDLRVVKEKLERWESLFATTLRISMRYVVPAFMFLVVLGLGTLVYSIKHLDDAVALASSMHR